MDVEDVRATARRFFEEQDRLRGGPAEDLCADGYAAHIAGLPTMGVEGHTQFAAAFYQAFADLHHVIEEDVTAGSRAVLRFRLVGTNTGSFMGSPPTGRPIDVAALAIMDVTDGKVTQVRGVFDRLGLMEQLGALPAP